MEEKVMMVELSNDEKRVLNVAMGIACLLSVSYSFNVSGDNLLTSLYKTIPTFDEAFDKIDDNSLLRRLTVS